jgi:hypothetical protein
MNIFQINFIGVLFIGIISLVFLAYTLYRSFATQNSNRVMFTVSLLIISDLALISNATTLKNNQSNFKGLNLSI